MLVNRFCTQMLLIDVRHSEWLNSKMKSEHLWCHSTEKEGFVIRSNGMEKTYEKRKARVSRVVLYD